MDRHSGDTEYPRGQSATENLEERSKSNGRERQEKLRGYEEDNLYVSICIGIYKNINKFDLMVKDYCFLKKY